MGAPSITTYHFEERDMDSEGSSSSSDESDNQGQLRLYFPTGGTENSTKERLSQGEHIHRRRKISTGITLRILQHPDPDFGMFVWPSSLVLASCIYRNRNIVASSSVIEIGAGTGLPGLLAGALGAETLLTDREGAESVFTNLRRSIDLNMLQSRCKVSPLSWGRFSAHVLGQLNSTTEDKTKPVLILASDVLYSSENADAVLATAAYLLEGRSELSAMWMTYQERSAHRSLRPNLHKWGFEGKVIQLDEFCPNHVSEKAETAGVTMLVIIKIPSSLAL